ncbi:MAG: hypothetical protein A2Y25_03450 [Candidatus Melainabacteria bacterium GWF2_37_15]|nr:MAG: hypothetical protein A2Y25_03450 [Candidatus Melainabacteria bacterium GWF2_37_15]
MDMMGYLITGVVVLGAGAGFYLWFFNKGRMYEVEYNKGIEAYQDSRFDDALQFFHKATVIDPEKTAAFYNLGLVYMDMKKDKESEKNFLKAINLDNNDPDSYYNLGLLYFNTNRNDDALKQFMQILRIKPDDLEALYLSGHLLTELKEYDEAIKLLEKAVEKDPHNSTYFMALGQAYDKRGAVNFSFDDLELAISAYLKCAELNPENEEVNYLLAICSAKKGLWEDCVKYCKRVIEINDKSERAYNQMGLAMYCSGDYDTAISMYKKAIETNPEYGDTYNNYGFVLEKQGNFTEAIKVFKKYLQYSKDVEAVKSLRKHIVELEESINSKNQG